MALAPGGTTLPRNIRSATTASSGSRPCSIGSATRRGGRRGRRVSATGCGKKRLTSWPAAAARFFPRRRPARWKAPWGSADSLPHVAEKRLVNRVARDRVPVFGIGEIVHVAVSPGGGAHLPSPGCVCLHGPRGDILRHERLERHTATQSRYFNGIAVHNTADESVVPVDPHQGVGPLLCQTGNVSVLGVEKNLVSRAGIEDEGKLPGKHGGRRRALTRRSIHGKGVVPELPQHARGDLELPRRRRETRLPVTPKHPGLPLSVLHLHGRQLHAL